MEHDRCSVTCGNLRVVGVSQYRRFTGAAFPGLRVGAAAGLPIDDEIHSHYVYSIILIACTAASRTYSFCGW
jgi:hypothetical protein